MKKLLAISCNILLMMFIFTLSPMAGAAAGIGISLLQKPAGALLAGVYTEVWTGEMVKKLRASEAQSFMEGIPDYSQYAKNNVIHLVDMGADPGVLINNTTYPIDIETLTDGDIAISLDKYQTKATKVTDDELYALSYDKIQSVKDRHAGAIMDKKWAKAIHALAPSSDATATPVIATTGDADSGRKMITRKDIIALKKRFDQQLIPTKGRRLVLCTDHVNDLLLTDQKFAEQYYNYQTGKISNLYGFEVYEYAEMPYFNGSTFAKKAFASTPTSGTDFMASVAFYVPMMAKVSGETKYYYQEASTAPLTQENIINYRHYFIVMPKKTAYIGAIASTKV